MSFLDWYKEEKEKEKKQGKTSSVTSTNNSSVNKNSDDESSSFIEWAKKEKEKTSSIDGWIKSATSLASEVQNRYKKWDGNEEAYNNYYNRSSELLAAANDWRNKYKDNKEITSYIDEVVSLLDNTQNYASKYHQYYSKFGSEAEFNDALKVNELYNLSTDEILERSGGVKHTSDSGRTHGGRGRSLDGEASTDKDNGIAYTTMGGQNITWQDLYDRKKDEEDFNSLYTSVTGNADFKNAIQSAKEYNNPDAKTAEKGGSVVNKVKYYEENQGMIAVGELNGGGSNIVTSNLRFMKDEEKDIYNYYFGRGEFDKAEEYLASLETKLRKRGESDQIENWIKVADELPVTSSIISIFTNVASGAEYIHDLIDYKKTGELDDNHLANIGTAIRGTVSEKVDWEIGNWDAFDFLYNSGMSMADSVASTVLLGQGGGIALGLSAAAQGTNDALNRGMSNKDAFWSGLSSGVFEGLFETFSIGNFKALKEIPGSTFKQIAKNIGNSMLVNATEETLTEIANIAYDRFVNTDFSQAETNVRAYMAAGMTEDEARSKVRGELIGQVVEAGASGALMGLGMGGGGQAIANINNRVATGQNIIDNKGYDDLKALALDVSAEASGIKSVDKAVAKADKKTSAWNVGGLSAKVDSVRGKQNLADIKTALVEKGMSEKEANKTAQKLIDVAEKASSGEQLSKAEYDAIRKDDVTREVYSSLLDDPNSSVNTRNQKHINARNGITKSEDGAVELSEAAQSRVTERVAQMVALDKVSSESRFRANTGIAEKDEDGMVIVSAEDAAAYKGKTTYTSPETGETKVVKIRGISSIKDGEMMLKLDNGETVDASDVRFSSEGEALVYSTMLDLGVNAGVAEALVNEFKSSGVSAGTYALGIWDAYKLGTINAPLSQLSTNSFARNLSDAQIQYVYKLGQTEAEAQVKADQKAINKGVAKAKGATGIKAGKVIVEDASIKVDESGNIDESALNPMQKANLAGVKALAELSPINFHIFQSDKINGKFVATINGVQYENAPNGVYIAGTNDIWIDLNAGNMGEGTMLWTAAHEISHYIRERSPAKWKAMADFLVKEYSKNKDISITDMLETQEAKIKAREDAGTKSETEIADETYEELVSDALSEMLTDGNVVNFLAELKQKDKGLWQTIKDAIADLLKRWGEVLGVYKDRDADTREAEALRGMEKAYKKLQKMYAEAFAEANAVEEAQAYLKENGIDVISDGKQEAASLNSVRNLLDNDQKQKVAKALADRFDVTEAEAMKWLTAETSLASLILNPKYSQYLDYEADASEDAIKRNMDYPQGTVDFSNICKKRRAFTEVIGRVLRNFPNHVFMAADLAKIRTIMEQEKMEVACAICYVEDRRQHDSIVAKFFIDSLALYRKGIKTRPDGDPFNPLQLNALSLIDGDTYTPSIYELVSLEGRNELKAKNPAMEEAWVKFNNARGMQSVRLLSNEAEYKRQILKYNKKTVQSKNNLGGLRIYSFSDAEMFHLIDIIQVITDSASVGLMLQGYTKVNEYAKAVKDTGEKLNRSLIPKGELGYHIEDGKVVLDFDTVEGIDINHPDFFDSASNPNVGNVVIGINETQIRAAMVSEFIDYIIPFHTGQTEEVLVEKGIAGWNNYEQSQFERDLSTGKKSKHQINIYTEVINAAEIEGKPITNKVDFVNKFLEVCKENGLEPRFSQFLNTNENGEYVYTEGYHKFLVDFKTFDQKTGEYLPQMPVKPIFDDAYITGLLKDYAKSQAQKDADTAKSMPKVIERITNEVVKPEMKFSERYKSAEENLDILSMVSKVESGNFKANEKVSLGIVSDSIAKQIQSLTGINVDGFKVAIEARQIEHILKDHGKQGLADQSMAEPSNIAKMEYTLNDPDAISKAGKTQAYTHMVNGRNRTVDTVLYEKNIGTKSYYVVQAIPDTKAKTLYIVTAFIGKEGYKKEASQLINAKSLDVTAKPGSANASTDIISQPSDSVKKKFSERNKAPTFYSQMGKVVDGIKNEKVGAGGVVPYLKGKGVKNEEIKWSGIEAFLEGKKSVTKAELQEFIAGSMLQIGEQMSSDDIDLRYDSSNHSYRLYDKDGNIVDTFTYNDFIGGYVSDATDEIYSNAVELEDAVRDEYGSMSSPRWADYKLDGGSNYREIVFTLPNSTYTNRAMKGHWGQDAEGILVHARIQDFDVNGQKMLFVEELQSDWHNEGHSEGYSTEEYEAAVATRDSLYDKYKKLDLAFHKYVRSNDFMSDPEDVRKKKSDWLRGKAESAQKKYLDAERDIEALKKKGMGDVPDAPFKDTYHEYVMKRLVRMAAEEGYDIIGWTPAEIQSERWSEEYAEGYRIEYDQDIPKFMGKFGKKWGTKVGTDTIAGTEVWSMPITDAMKESVLYEGQALYSERKTDSNRSLLANALETTVQNDVEAQKLAQYKEKIALIDAEQQRLSEINAEIRELSFSKGKRDEARLKSLRFDAVQAANRINTYDRQLLTLESTKVLKAVLDREKGLARKRQKQQNAEALKQYKEKVTETRDKREAVKKLQKIVLDTAKWVSYPAKDDVKVPDILKAPYAEFLSSIDLSSKRLLKGGEATQNDMRITSAMSSLATAIEQIKQAQNPTSDVTDIPKDALDSGYLDLPVNFITNLRTMTENIKKLMIPGDFVVGRMSAQDVKQISRLIRTLNHAIKEMSTLYSNLRFAHAEEIGDNSISFLEEIGEAKKTNAALDFVSWDNALPYYAFKRFGKAGESIFEELMDGQDKLAHHADEIFKFKEKHWTDKEANAWGKDTHTIKLPSGNEVTLTTADAMGIYCLSRREQAVPHLLGGGIRVVGQKKGMTQAKDSRTTLTEADLNAIISSLSKRQIEVAEAMQEFMSTVSAEWGNEISMKRFLTREFREKNYYPIESSDENLPVKDKMAQQADLYRLLNISATKPLTEGANNAVVIRNIFEVFTSHTSDMAKLNAFGMPLLDYVKWVNYREKATNDEGQITTRGVRQAMNTAYGDKAFSYVLGLIKDVNGRYNDGGDHAWLVRMTRAAKTAMVGNSLRVAVLQVTSYPRAGLILSQKSLALGLTKKPQIRKAQKYCGIALWKSFGFYDTNISRSIEDQIKGTTDIKQKLIEWSLKGAEWGDALTWGLMWNACEYEVAQNNKSLKVGSEEFNEAVGKKLREVVYATQVVDSTLTRSQIMRNKSGLTQGATAFMSEPTVSANILMDAAFQFNLEQRRSGSAKTAWNKTGKYIGRSVAIYSVGQLTAAMIEAVMDAYRDDDDEEYAEKFLEAFKENAISDLNPLNKIPIISDMVEWIMSRFGIGYFSSDNLTTTWLSQAANAYDAWAEVLGKENTSKTVYNAIYNTTRALSSVSGIAIAGLMREAVALWNNTAGAYDSTLKVKTYKNTKTQTGKLLYDAIISGDKRQAESLKAQFENEDAVNKALVKALRENDPRIKKAAEARLNGDMTLYKQVALEIKGEGHFSQDIIVTAINNEMNALKKGESSSGFTPSPDFTNKDYFNAAVSGDAEDVNAVKEYLIESGKTETQIQSSFNSSVKDAYEQGEINSMKAVSLMIEYGGKTSDEADLSVKYIDFKAEYPDYADSVTESKFSKYYEPIADYGNYSLDDMGISLGDYADYCEITAGIKGTDADGDGKTDSGSKKALVMQVIDSLPLTSSQKDALYFLNGWSSKTLYEAPWY